ncbi:MAG: DNA recombination protein RmuC, partial [bacterium]
MAELALVVALVGLVAIAIALWQLLRGARAGHALEKSLKDKHRAMLADLHGGLAAQTDRLNTSLAESTDRLRGAVAEELRQTRETLHALQLSIGANLSETGEKLNAKIDGRLD